MNFEQDAAISEISDILSNYDLGKLVDLERNERGYINISYSIQTIKQGKRFDYFLRRYKIGIQSAEIEFEHAVIDHLIARNFTLVARLIETVGGSTYCTKYFEDDPDQPIFYAIFEFLPGVDKYTWVDPQCSPKEVALAAQTLGLFHQAVADFTPKGRRSEPRIIDLLPEIANNLKLCEQKSQETEFDKCLSNQLHDLVNICTATHESLQMVAEGDLPSIVIHCDYHPGNLKFSGEEIVGLFDFDWSKIDLRCFDIALTGWYFFTSWRGSQDGHFRVGEFLTFMNSYQESFHDQAPLESLNEVELTKLPWLINAANLYVLNWTVADYYSNDVDEDEYLIYLRHSLNFSKWFESEGQTLIIAGINQYRYFA